MLSRFLLRCYIAREDKDNKNKIQYLSWEGHYVTEIEKKCSIQFILPIHRFIIQISQATS